MGYGNFHLDDIITIESLYTDYFKVFTSISHGATLFDRDLGWLEAFSLGSRSGPKESIRTTKSGSESETELLRVESTYKLGYNARTPNFQRACAVRLTVSCHCVAVDSRDGLKGPSRVKTEGTW